MLRGDQNTLNGREKIGKKDEGSIGLAETIPVHKICKKKGKGGNLMERV